MYGFLMPVFPYLLGILGLIVGSFLNVVILRREQDKSLGGRSGCPHCKTTLSWYELIPVISFLVQGGKCRTCKKNISFQYIIVELATGLSFFAGGLFLVKSLAVAFLSPGFIVAVIGLVVMLSFAVSITAYDIHTKTVPLNWFVGMVLASIVYLVGIHNFYFTLIDIWRHVAGILVAIPFLIVWAFSNGRLMGFADIEIIAWMGFFFGAMIGTSSVLTAFYIGAIFSVLLVTHKIINGVKYSHIRTMQIPFTPFLIIAWFGTLVFSWNVFTLFARLFI